MEVWVDAKGYPGYEVSSEGRIRNKKTGRILHQYEGTARDCNRVTGFDHSAISKCLSGKQDNYKGYHFEKIKD